MSRIVAAIGAAWGALTAQKRATRSTGTDDWVYPTVGTYGQTYNDLGLRHNHEALTRMAVQWVGICSAFNAVECASVPIRLYRKSGTKGMVGRWAGRRVSDRKQLKWLKNASRAGPGTKAAQYAEQAGDIEEIVDSPILDLLHHPNPWDSCATYHRRLFQSLELCGNGYEKWAEDGEAFQLLGMLPQWTRVQPDDEMLIGGYCYGRERVNERVYAPDEVLHHMHMPAMDNHWYGVGPLYQIISESNIFAQAISYELNTLINGIRPSDIVIEAGEDTVESTVEAMRAELDRKYRGARQAGKPMILVNATAKNLALKNTDMQYREGQKAIMQMTMAAYGTNEELIMRSGSSLGGDKVKTDAYKIYARLTLVPRLSAVSELRNAQLVPKFGIEPGEVWFAYDDPSPDDNTADAEMGKNLVPVGIMTINEARAAIDLPPEEGGDDLRINGIPLADVAKNAAAMAAGPDKPGGGGKDKASSTGIWWQKSRWQESLATKDDDLRARPVKMTVNELESNLLAWFKGIHPQIMQGADYASGGFTLALDPAEQAAFTEAVMPPLSKAGVLGYNRSIVDLDAVGKLPATMGKIESLGSGAAEVLRGTTGKLFRSVTSSLTDHIRESLAAGVEAGENLTQLTARVKEIAGPGTENASYMIARTETARAYNTSREDGWKQSGNVKYKKWVLSGNPCPLCRAMAAKFGKVPVGQPMLGVGESISFAGGMFTNDYLTMNGPPAHPHCACGISAVFE